MAERPDEPANPGADRLSDPLPCGFPASHYSVPIASPRASEPHAGRGERDGAVGRPNRKDVPSRWSPRSARVVSPMDETLPAEPGQNPAGDRRTGHFSRTEAATRAASEDAAGRCARADPRQAIALEPETGNAFRVRQTATMRWLQRLSDRPSGAVQSVDASGCFRTSRLDASEKPRRPCGLRATITGRTCRSSSEPWAARAPPGRRGDGSDCLGFTAHENTPRQSAGCERRSGENVAKDRGRRVQPTDGLRPSCA